MENFVDMESKIKLFVKILKHEGIRNDGTILKVSGIWSLKHVPNEVNHKNAIEYAAQRKCQTFQKPDSGNKTFKKLRNL